MVSRFRAATTLCNLAMRCRVASVHKVALNSFDTNAGLYSQVRPSYPREAVKVMVDQLPHDQPCQILDLAAGTGIFTKVLFDQLPFTASLVAVEPVTGMRQTFQEFMSPHVSVLEGTSTSIPFPDDYFDMVTIAQAFHWFATTESLAEIHRVLKKDGKGTLALIWNLESNEEEWVGKLRSLYEAFDGDVPQYRTGHWENAFNLGGDSTKKPYFDLPLDRRFFRQEMLVTPLEVWERVLSKSYITALGPIEQEALREKVLQLVFVEYAHKFVVERQDAKLCAIQPLDVEVVIVKTAADDNR